MKKFLPALALVAFFPAFTLSAEKITAQKPVASFLANLNGEVFPGENGLDSTVLVIRSNAELPAPELRVSCSSEKTPLFSRVSKERAERLEAVFVRFDRECQNIRASLYVPESDRPGRSGRPATPVLEIPTDTKEKRFLALSDLSDDALFLYARDSRESSAKFASAAATARKTFSGAVISDKFRILSLSYRAAALDSKVRSVEALLLERKELSYLVPIAGTPIPSERAFIPGALRSYRKGVTDGIHHGWDLMVPVWTPVRAVANGVVVRVESGFSWKDFDRVAKTPTTEDGRLKNLDIYRGNQVWLKTADGNVTFYSHLQSIAPGIAAGVSVAAGEILGSVGVSGVPDRAYKNPHLHFEIQKNPHDGTDTSDPLSVMRWEYLGKGMKLGNVRDLAETAFR